METFRTSRKRKASLNFKEDAKPRDERSNHGTNDDSDDTSGDEKECINRKSLRLSKMKSHSNKSRSSLDGCKLNGAQFIAAASVGNLSPLSTVIQIDSNGQVDLNKLLQHIDLLNKTLNQHSILFKKLNNSIEKLSDKLDFTIKSISENKLDGLCSLISNKNDKNRLIELNDENDENNDDDDDQKEDDMNEVEKLDESCSKSQSQITTVSLKNMDHLENSNFENSHIKKNSMSPEVNNNDVNNNNITNERDNFISDSSENNEDENDGDDDSDEDYDSGSIRRSGKKKTSNSCKGSNFAILNKTKIDTEFISGLIADKDSKDKRYDPIEINKLRLLSHSYQNFAVKLLVRLFDEEEILGRNVYGRNYSGDKSIMKQPLDPERINFIKQTVLRLTKTNNPELAWASCVIAMNRKLVDINNKHLKNINNNKVKN